MERDNLNKENFWDELYADYPEAVQVFCDWIDKYKAENNWDELFNGGLLLHPSHPSDIQTSSPKFHDLPHALQMGIWIQFVQEYTKGNHIILRLHYNLPFVMTDFKGQVRRFIQLIDETLK